MDGRLTEVDEYIGKKYGRLMVIKFDKYVGYHKKYLCRCDCGKEKSIWLHSLKDGSTQSCGCHAKEVRIALRKKQSMENHPSWSGGKIDKDGYVLVLAHNHPHPSNRWGYVYEHRLVVEKSIGRLLTRKETVHHKNGIRHDNRLENLELRSSAHGPGASVDDLISYALEVLELYAPWIEILDKRCEAEGWMAA